MLFKMRSLLPFARSVFASKARFSRCDIKISRLNFKIYTKSRFVLGAKSLNLAAAKLLFDLLADKFRALQKEKVIPRQRIKFAIFDERVDQLAAF